MNRLLRWLLLARAFACYHIVGLIGFFAYYVPRSATKAWVVNALTAPFFGPAGWWALSKNPSFQKAVRKSGEQDQ